MEKCEEYECLHFTTEKDDTGWKGCRHAEKIRSCEKCELASCENCINAPYCSKYKKHIQKRMHYIRKYIVTHFCIAFN